MTCICQNISTTFLSFWLFGLAYRKRKYIFDYFSILSTYQIKCSHTSGHHIARFEIPKVKAGIVCRRFLVFDKTAEFRHVRIDFIFLRTEPESFIWKQRITGFKRVTFKKQLKWCF